MSMTETVENSENTESAEISETTEDSVDRETAKTESTHSTEAYSLITDFNLILHTKPAQTICNGDWAPGKMGLRQFATHVNHLWQALEQQDPYAEWVLLKIYDAIQALKTEMHQQEITLRKQLYYLRGIRVKPFRQPNPFIIVFSTANPITLMGASLISQIDMLACQILTLKQMGIVPQGLTNTQLYREKVEKIFVLTQDWEESGITREEILDNTKKAQRLQKKYGQVPEDILLQKTPLPFLLMEE